MSKVIFLDIDGVMIAGSHLKRTKSYPGYQFHPDAVKNLNEIIAQTNALIVITSTWRKGKSIAELQKMFEENGIEQGVIGQTPIVAFGTRGQEIHQYLEESLYDPSFDIEKFIIIDDNNNMGDLKPFLVQTNWDTGLDEKAKKRAIEKLLF
jgi:nicotinamidase-related amidase